MRSLGASQEIRYRLLSYLAEHPDATQRELARQLGVSVGKVNYSLKSLVAQGWVNCDHHLYVLTPKGVAEKVKVTSAFLRCKLDEYEQLRKEIARLRSEVRAAGGGNGR